MASLRDPARHATQRRQQREAIWRRRWAICATSLRLRRRGVRRSVPRKNISDPFQDRIKATIREFSRPRHQTVMRLCGGALPGQLRPGFRPKSILIAMDVCGAMHEKLGERITRLGDSCLPVDIPSASPRPIFPGGRGRDLTNSCVKSNCHSCNHWFAEWDSGSMRVKTVSCRTKWCQNAATICRMTIAGVAQ